MPCFALATEAAGTDKTVVVGSVAVVGGTVAVTSGTEVVVGDVTVGVSSTSGVEGVGTGVVADDIVNIAPAPAVDKTKSPAAVQIPGEAHETEEKVVGGKSDCTPLANAAGRASSHTPFVDVMVNATTIPIELTNCPTAVQFPAVAHDTEFNDPVRVSFWASSPKTATSAVFQTPFAEVIVNASSAPSVFLKDPTAVQFPAVGHDTELKRAPGNSCWTPVGNSAGCACSHTPFVDVMVNASLASNMLLNHPTAVQFPGDAHDTELNSVIGEIGWIPSANSAGRASAHSLFVDVMVNASREASKFLNLPTAVQFPGEAHDTEAKLASGESLWTPAGNTAGRARPHTPPDDVIVNASLKPSEFLNCPTAVQFPDDAHDTQLKRASGLA